MNRIVFKHYIWQTSINAYVCLFGKKYLLWLWLLPVWSVMLVALITAIKTHDMRHWLFFALMAIPSVLAVFLSSKPRFQLDKDKITWLEYGVGKPRYIYWQEIVVINEPTFQPNTRVRHQVLIHYVQQGEQCILPFPTEHFRYDNVYLTKTEVLALLHQFRQQS